METNSSKHSPIIVAGMHRSGSSWISSELAALGIDFGNKLLAASQYNKNGYFEDETFVKFNRTMLNSFVPHSNASFIDWGWSEGADIINTHKLSSFSNAAKHLVANFANNKSIWAWKDPRNTILLDFWKSIIPNAKFVFVYRFPWDVADSMQRLEYDNFIRNPDWAYKIWLYYNTKMLAFYRKNKANCLLLSTNEMAKAPQRLASLIKEKWQIDLGNKISQPTFDPKLFRSNYDACIAKELTAICQADAIKLFEQIEQEADLPTENIFSNGRLLRFNRAWPKEKSAPKISVIIPCYNQGLFVPDALMSLESFAPDETEVLIMNDGSTESGTLKMLDKVSVAGYQVLHQENQGLPQTRNILCQLAQSDIILPLDADNRICDHFINRALETLSSNPNIGIVYGNRREFGLRNREVIVPAFDLDTILTQNYIDACALIRKQVVTSCGGYDLNVTILEDWELWINAAKQGWEFLNLDFITFEYRVRPSSLVTKLQDISLKDKIHSYIQSKHADLYLPWQASLVKKLREEINNLRKVQASEKIQMATISKNLLDKNQTLQDKITQLEAGLNTSQQRIVQLEQSIDKITNSRSWKLTAPLRSIAETIRH